MLVCHPLDHPAAAVIANITRTTVESLSPDKADTLSIDVIRLADLAEGRAIGKPMDSLTQIKTIRHHLDQAERTALALPEGVVDTAQFVVPEGKSIASIISDAISALQHKLAHAEGVAASQSGLFPVSPGEPPNWAARWIACAAIEIFERRTGRPAKFAKGRSPSTRYGQFVCALFKAFDIRGQNPNEIASPESAMMWAFEKLGRLNR